MLLVFSHSGFSDTDANGITMKKLLSAYEPSEKAQFYLDTAQPDFTAAEHYFRVTDVQMIKAFLLKKSKHIFTPEKTTKTTASKAAAKKVPGFLKKRKYNFTLKYLREKLWGISPWGHRALKKWIDALAPQALVYMVGESHFMDKLVLKTCKRTGKPLVLYNGEAYRIIDLKQRHGLERMYYRKSHKLYRKLLDRASLVLYNCPMLQRDYEKRYGEKKESSVAYNTAVCAETAQIPEKIRTVTYFGNLGVGRDESLMRVAKQLRSIDPSLHIDVYGKALPEIEQRLNACEGIRLHGFLQADELHRVIENTDLLLHVESFDPAIMPKLRYAFSTKIAQCLCAGRCFLSFAPEQTASTQYLLSVGASVATNETELKEQLESLVHDRQARRSCAEQALCIGRENHHGQAELVRRQIGAILNGT